MKDKHCKATFPADIFAACCGATSALSLDLVTLAVAARDCCLHISFIEPIKCFEHLLSKHSVDIKHKLIALSCVMVLHNSHIFRHRKRHYPAERGHSSSWRLRCCSLGSSRSSGFHNGVHFCKCLFHCKDLRQWSKVLQECNRRLALQDLGKRALTIF